MISIVVRMQPAIETSVFDPLLARISLPFSRTYYPVGFPLNLTTNSQDVLDTAAESWGQWELGFARDPVEIRIVVQPEGSLSPQPSFRCQRHLFTMIGDADNFAVADLERLFGFVLVSARTAADHRWLRWFFLESVAYALLAQRYAVPVHAACIASNGRGVLLCGVSGAGKSTLAWACARVGWTFFSDDCTWLLPDSSDCEVIGRPDGARFRADAVSFFPELEGFVERARPNGKLSVEVPLSAFPQIQTAAHGAIHYLAFLHRGHGKHGFRKLTPSDTLDRLLRDRATYGPHTDELHESVFRTLASLPAYQLHYQTLEDGRSLLASLTDET